jgi:hypothetical protein
MPGPGRKKQFVSKTPPVNVSNAMESDKGETCAAVRSASC